MLQALIKAIEYTWTAEPKKNCFFYHDVYLKHVIEAMWNNAVNNIYDIDFKVRPSY